MQQRSPVLSAFGSNIRRQRESKELTQEKLAELAGLDPTYISGIERGLRNPGIRNVVKIAKALSLSTSELCRGIDQ
jgi:transcriptional regulator with XRE-family HTH domain